MRRLGYFVLGMALGSLIVSAFAQGNPTGPPGAEIPPCEQMVSSYGSIVANLQLELAKAQKREGALQAQLAEQAKKVAGEKPGEPKK